MRARARGGYTAVVGVHRALAVAAVALSVAPHVASAPAQSPSAALLQTYLPVLVFHPDERWPPADPAAFVGASRLEERGATGGWSVSSRTSLPDSSVPCARVPCFRLNL